MTYKVTFIDQGEVKRVVAHVYTAPALYWVVTRMDRYKARWAVRFYPSKRKWMVLDRWHMVKHAPSPTGMARWSGKPVTGFVDEEAAIMWAMMQVQPASVPA